MKEAVMKKILIAGLVMFFCSFSFAKSFDEETLKLEGKLSNGFPIEIIAIKSKVTGTFATFYGGGENWGLPEYFIFSINVRINKLDDFVPMSALSNLYNPLDISYKEVKGNKVEIIITGDEVGNAGELARTQYIAIIYYQLTKDDGSKDGYFERIKRKWELINCHGASEETTYSYCIRD
jgi:hypothetical protein